MDQSYFVFEFAHSQRSRSRRIHISRKFLGYVLGTFLTLSIVILALFSSYVQMSWRASHYDELRAQFDRLRSRYQELQRESKQHSQQMAALENLASEVSVAYGIKQPGFSVNNAARDVSDPLTTNPEESIEQYNFLKSASFSSIYHRYAYQWQVHTQPSLWPVNGLLTSSFGGRTDPLSGEGAFHKGIDLCAAPGTPVHVTADGVVASAGWSSGYGRLVVVDHGNGLETYYAHLSQFRVIPGQEVRSGQVIALSGASGRVTSPHVHYEVRVKGIPVNPYKYLARARTSAPRHTSLNDFGL